MIKVTLIRPKGCTHCIAVKKVLEKLLKENSNLVVEEIDMVTPEGQALVQKHGILSSPGILVNDEFFMMGGATEDQFRKKFEGLR
ncbi:MAG: thioredoxin family protein [Candidatus Harrisonbacteria bacterium]|nr:thioredoxin family protein [Candidatus Harrisonbacteria bacterium]